MVDLQVLRHLLVVDPVEVLLKLVFSDEHVGSLDGRDVVVVRMIIAAEDDDAAVRFETITECWFYRRMIDEKCRDLDLAVVVDDAGMNHVQVEVGAGARLSLGEVAADVDILGIKLLDPGVEGIDAFWTIELERRSATHDPSRIE